MKLFLIPKTKILVLFRTRGEHRPPHVHVENREVPWEARVRFSFVEDGDIAVLDIDPEENEPSAAVMRRVIQGLADEVDFLRRRWWEIFQTVCLEGKWIRALPRTEGQPQFEVLKSMQWGASRATRVVFDPATRKLMFLLENGKTFDADVGRGHDLSDHD